MLGDYCFYIELLFRFGLLLIGLSPILFFILSLTSDNKWYISLIIFLLLIPGAFVMVIAILDYTKCRLCGYRAFFWCDHNTYYFDEDIPEPSDYDSSSS